jgi:hypothetical protein
MYPIAQRTGAVTWNTDVIGGAGTSGDIGITHFREHYRLAGSSLSPLQRHSKEAANSRLIHPPRDIGEKQ